MGAKVQQFGMEYEKSAGKGMTEEERIMSSYNKSSVTKKKKTKKKSQLKRTIYELIKGDKAYDSIQKIIDNRDED